MGRKRKRPGIIIALLLIIIAGSAALFFLLGKNEQESIVPAEREAVVTSNTYTQVIDISGYVEPYDSQTLRFRSTGAVTGVYVPETVAEGQNIKKLIAQASAFLDKFALFAVRFKEFNLPTFSFFDNRLMVISPCKFKLFAAIRLGFKYSFSKF